MFNSNSSVRSFQPFKSGTMVASHIIGTSVCKGRRTEYLFLGNGVFIGTRNITKAKVIKFCGKYHKFECFKPMDSSLNGIINVYFVNALLDVEPPVQVIPEFPIGGCVHLELDGLHKVKPAPFVGGDLGFTDSCVQAARDYGLSKWKLPAGKHFNSTKYYNELVPVWHKGAEYVAILSYHRVQDPTRSNSAGSLRTLSMKTFSGTQWRRA